MNSRAKIILSISATAMLAAASIIFLILPLLADLDKYSKDILLQKEKLASLDAETKNFEDFKEIKNQIGPNLDKALSLLIDKNLPLDFINFLESTSRDYHLSLSMSSSALSSQKGVAWPFFVFQIKNSGSFSDLSRFLERLENSGYLIEIQSLSVSAAGGKVTSDLSMKVFAK